MESARVKYEKTDCVEQAISHYSVNQMCQTENVKEEWKPGPVPQDVSSTNVKQEPGQEVSKPRVLINNRPRRPVQYIIVPAPGKVVNPGVMQPFGPGRVGPWAHYRQPFMWRGNSSAMMHPHHPFVFPTPRPLVRPVYKCERPVRSGEFEHKVNAPQKPGSTQLKRVTTKCENTETKSGVLMLKDVKVDNTQEESSKFNTASQEETKLSGMSEEDKYVDSPKKDAINTNGNMQFWNTLGITTKFGGAAEEIAKCALMISHDQEHATRKNANERIKIRNMSLRGIQLESTPTGDTKALDRTGESKHNESITKCTAICPDIAAKHVNPNCSHDNSMSTLSLKEANKVDSVSTKSVTFDSVLGRPVELETPNKIAIKVENMPEQLIKVEHVAAGTGNKDKADLRHDFIAVQPTIKMESLDSESEQPDKMLDQILKGVKQVTTINEEILNGTISASSDLVNQPKMSSSSLETAGIISTIEKPCKSIQPWGEVVNKDPDNVLPGTNIAYRTPGTNKVNKNGKIKRPMNAFMVWARTYRAKMAEEFPHRNNSEVSVRLGQVWTEMTSDQKRPYYLEAEKIKQRHRMLYPEWCYTPSPRRLPQSEPPTAETVAHNIYWARYSNGSIIKSLSSLMQSVKTEPQTSTVVSDNPIPDTALNRQAPPVVVVPDKIETGPSNPASISNPVEAPALSTASIPGQTPADPLKTPVYTPIPFNTPLLQTKAGGKSAPVVTSTVSTLPANVKLEKPDTVSEKPKTETKPVVTAEATCTDKANCQCVLHSNSKKRARKPRVRRKDREKLGDGKAGKRGGRNTIGVSNKTKEERADEVHPVDPYNPFYLLNLEQEYVDTPDDVDIDRWQTYLGDNKSLAFDYSKEPGYNLDVFLSEARVSQSASSVDSGDIEILPTPVATTLDRLQSPSTSSKIRNRKIIDPLNQINVNQTGPELSTTWFDSMYAQIDQSPNGNDMFVINEEIVVTTPHEPVATRGLGEADAGGAGDSFVLDKSKHFQIYPTPPQSDRNSFPWLGSNTRTVSPPGKRICM